MLLIGVGLKNCAYGKCAFNSNCEAGTAFVFGAKRFVNNHWLKVESGTKLAIILIIPNICYF